MTPNFFDLTYLSKGSAVQQAGFRAIVDSGIMTLLKEFSPVVVGTLPLDLFTSKSDIDIICYYSDAEDFQSFLKNSIRKQLNGIDSVISIFEFNGFKFEIVGQPLPVKDQYAYRHLVVEWEILQENGDGFRREVMSLKNSGMKTEPAFAQLLGLEGDAYEALLNYKLPLNYD